MSRTYEEKIVIGSKVDSRGFKKADKELKKLGKTVKNLASGFGIAFSARSIALYGKNAVEAFAADDKAARVLSKTLSNLGLQFADPKVKEFIADLEKQYGVLDDFLRPAYQKLLTSTGDWAKSQDLLKTALDLSAQSGVDLITVAEDLGKAYVGNTRGLQKYSLGITKAELASLSFEEILKRVAKITEGQAAEAANTYSGKLDKLKVAASNASETIGGALLDAIIKFSGGDIDKATSKVNQLSKALAGVINIATGSGKMTLKDALAGVDFKYGFIPTDRPKYAPTRGGAAGAMANQAAEKKAQADALKKEKERLAAQAKLTKLQQDQLKLAKAKAVFDLQQIQIEAALKGKISEEEKLRLKLMKAILDENTTDAEKYQKALDAAQTKTKEMSELLASIKTLEIKDPFSTWQIDPLTQAINGLTTSIGGVSTQIQASGREWSSFANTVANTVLRPNLSEWSSSFSSASAAASAANAAATASLNATTAAATKAAQDAAASSAAAIAAANKASADAIAKADTEAKTAIEKLKKDAADAAAAANKAATDAIAAANKTAQESVASILAAADAAAKAAASSSATSSGTGTSAIELLKVAESASAATTTGNTTVIVNVEGSVIAENDLATAINDAVNNSSWAGNAIGYGAQATIVAK